MRVAMAILILAAALAGAEPLPEGRWLADLRLTRAARAGADDQATLRLGDLEFRLGNRRCEVYEGGRRLAASPVGLPAAGRSSDWRLTGAPGWLALQCGTVSAARQRPATDPRELTVTGRGCTVELVRVQPTEPPSAADDFLRRPGDLGDWTPRAGHWSIAEYRDPLVAKFGLAAQATWLRGEPEGGPAVAVFGSADISDYAVAAHVRRGDGADAGVAFAIRDDRYGLLRLGGAGAELLIVAGGRETRLAGLPTVGPPGLWHALRVELSRGWLRATVDGGPAISVAAPHLLDGAAGLWCDGPADFDDMLVEPVTLSPGDQAAGLAFDAGTVTARLKPTARDTVLALRADGEPRLTFALQRAGQAVEWSLRRGAESLAEGRRPTVDALGLTRRGPAVEAWLDDRRVAVWYGLAAPTTAEASGGADDVWVRSLATDRPAEVFATVFDAVTLPGKQKDEVWRVLGDILEPAGRGWELPRPDADDGGQLLGRARGRDTALWYRESLPGDTCLRVALNALDDAAALTLRLGGVDGFGLRLTTTSAALLRDETVLAERALAARPRVAEVGREGRWLAAEVDGERLLARDDAPPSGGRPGLELTGGGVALGSLTVASRNAVASTFGRIDCDWREDGEWLWNTGMACIAWSHWVTGDGRTQPAALWRRERLDGDVTVRFHVSETTEGYDDERHAADHQHFAYHDVSLVIDGDGSDLDSGYRFLIGADGGHGVRLLRRGQVVAEQPRFRIFLGPHCNEPRSIHVDADRRGGRLTLWLNEREMLDWTDPEPLTGEGRIALAVDDCRANFSDLIALLVDSAR